MLTLGNFPSKLRNNTLFQNPLSQNPQSTSKSVSFPTNPKSHVFFGKIRSGFCLNALKTQKKGSINSSDSVVPDELEDDFDDEFFDVEDDGEIEEDDDDDVFIPLENMKKWLEKKPRGFGEGKVYDTSIEDKLMEEIEQSRIAQLANVNKLKNNPVKPTTPQKQASVPIQEGFRVRLVNLPKKKNIHKDLKLALKDVPGILGIVPVVFGNEKTRDPVCKGIAFIDFKHEDEANRFVQNFSGRSINFGKVQKNIKCEIMNTKLPKPLNDGLNKTKPSPQKSLLRLDEDSKADIDMEIPSFDTRDKSTLREDRNAEERQMIEQCEDGEELGATSSVSNSSLSEESEIDSSSSLNQGGKIKQNERKVASKKKKEDKIPKLKIPGSANRLKIRDKELLSGVFSKYGLSGASTVKEPSK